MLRFLILRRNRITTLGSSLQKLLRLELLRVESNRLCTFSKEQIPASLRDLYLAELVAIRAKLVMPKIKVFP
ncbi:hypothetical protein CEXT_243861 [Caerostris extrusa]|uniref:Uncharacterized protein n=1 Tax=Caerostris extrusa TaxID=172846 RepID=A0AAV4THG3_CAEEX|nr:hypothetical protein CEXT_243861 [Caerostris extrusa]